MKPIEKKLQLLGLSDASLESSGILVAVCPSFFKAFVHRAFRLFLLSIIRSTILAALVLVSGLIGWLQKPCALSSVYAHQAMFIGYDPLRHFVDFRTSLQTNDLQ